MIQKYRGYQNIKVTKLKMDCKDIRNISIKTGIYRVKASLLFDRCKFSSHPSAKVHEHM